MALSGPATGTLLAGKYRVIAKVGEGGMGAVFRAQNIVTSKHVAIKWMHPHVAANSDAAARLLREAQAASRLSHPNVVDVYDIVQDEQSLFLVMELLEGETLRAYLQRNARPKISEFIALLLPALEGVAAAHDKGVIHRDLKPDNIFLVRVPGSKRVTAKVVDFGIAKVAGTQGLTLTGTGMSLGTPLYMSLEQLRGDKDVDGRLDVYAFGVMLYEAIAGQTPYDATTLSELAIKVATTDPTPIKQLRPDLPTALGRVVDWAIARKREQRLPTVRSLIQELEPFAQDYSFRNQMTNQAISLPRLAVGDRPGSDSEHLASRATSLPPPPLAAAPAPAPPRRVAPGAPSARPPMSSSGSSASTDTLTARELAPASHARKHWRSLSLAAGVLAVVALLVGVLWLRRTQLEAATPKPALTSASSLRAAAPVELRAPFYPRAAAPVESPRPAAPASVAALAQPQEPAAAPASAATAPRPEPSARASVKVSSDEAAPVSAHAARARSAADDAHASAPAAHPGASPKPRTAPAGATSIAASLDVPPQAAKSPPAAPVKRVEAATPVKSAADILAF